MRRTLAALEVSVVSLKAPISAVERTCVPPHSSRDHAPSPTSTIRTTSPYFSPNSAIAPSARASSSVVVSARTGWLARIHSLTRSSTHATSSAASGAPWVKSKRSLSGPDVGAGLAHVRAEALAQRRVQEVRGGVVALGGAARGAVDERDHALALVQLARDRLEHQHLVVADPQHVGDARGAVARLAADLAGVVDLAAAGGVERRLDELDQQPPVLPVHRADRRRLLDGLVAGEGRVEARRVGEHPRALAVLVAAAAPGARARPRALLLHQVLEAGRVDAQPLLRRELEREVEREAVGVVELEGLGRADALVARPPSRGRCGPARIRVPCSSVWPNASSSRASHMSIVSACSISSG